MPTLREWRERGGAAANRLGQSLRRLAISSTASLLWKLTGHQDDDGNVEPFEAQVFNNVGTYARPPAGRGHAVVVLLGGKSGAPVVVATRDAATLAAVLERFGVAADESLLYNSAAAVHVKADGTIEARTGTGIAVELMTKADGDNLTAYLRSQFDPATGHQHKAINAALLTALAPSAVPSSNPNALVPTVVGTKKLKGE